MTQILADATLSEKLKSLTGPATLIDEGGRTIGYFQPAGFAPPGWARANSPTTREELERRRAEARKHPEDLKPLPEIIKHLESSVGGGS